jgi:serine/threonine-protein kinase
LVALKVLTAVEEDRTAVLRFAREARITAALTSAHTVRVFDFGQEDDGCLYLAMELLAGRTVSDDLRGEMSSGRVYDQPRTLAVARAVLHSLREAHAAGLVHRDLKPQNLFLHEPRAGETVVKVLDFGIARGSGQPLTGSVVVGTAQYMSPEQAQSLPLDGRSDLYALGVILFQLVTGRVPFAGETPLQTLYLHVSAPLPPIRTSSRTGLDDRFAAAVERALCKDPAQRFADADDMLRALDGSTPVALHPGPATLRDGVAVAAPTIRLQQARFLRRWLSWTVGALVVAAGLALLVGRRAPEVAPRPSEPRTVVAHVPPPATLPRVPAAAARSEVVVEPVAQPVAPVVVPAAPTPVEPPQAASAAAGTVSSKRKSRPPVAPKPPHKPKSPRASDEDVLQREL